MSALKDLFKKKPVQGQGKTVTPLGARSPGTRNIQTNEATPPSLSNLGDFLIVSGTQVSRARGVTHASYLLVTMMSFVLVSFILSPLLLLKRKPSRHFLLFPDSSAPPVGPRNALGVKGRHPRCSQILLAPPCSFFVF